MQLLNMMHALDYPIKIYNLRPFWTVGGCIHLCDWKPWRKKCTHMLHAHKCTQSSFMTRLHIFSWNLEKAAWSRQIIESLSNSCLLHFLLGSASFVSCNLQVAAGCIFVGFWASVCRVSSLFHRCDACRLQGKSFCRATDRKIQDK